MTGIGAALQFAERITYGKTFNVTFTGEDRYGHGMIEVVDTRTGETFHLTVEKLEDSLTVP